MTCIVSKINDKKNKSVKDERWSGETYLEIEDRVRSKNQTTKYPYRWVVTAINV